VPPTGAKGLNLAVADVAALATALVRLVRDGQSELADAYSEHCLERVWRATHLACWMTTMMHVVPGQDEFESELQLAQLRNLVTSRAAATMLAENYTGYAPLRYDPATRLGPAEIWASSVA
jgi:p-hydroxybenzoate 3-monooxygenase